MPAANIQQMLEMIQAIDVEECKCPLWSKKKRCRCKHKCDCPRLTLPPCRHVLAAEARFEALMTEKYGRSWRENDDDDPDSAPRPILYWEGLLLTYLRDEAIDPDDCQKPINAMPGPKKVRHLEHRRFFGVKLWHPDDASPVLQSQSLNLTVATKSTKLGKKLAAPPNGAPVFGDPELQQVADPDDEEDGVQDDPDLNERLKRIDALLAKVRGHGRETNGRGH